MADPVTLREAEDGFARYYAEKLWSWIPEVYRDADFTSPRGAVLRPLIEIIGAEAAVARREIDRLWDNVLIDYADEWAVPYIGELIGARLLNSINGRGVRVDVARTLAYRRRTGTVSVLDELIEDMTGWSGVVVEAWKRLGRHWHGLDDPPYPSAQHGAMAKGGFADLRLRRNCDALDSAFDTFSHRPDFRRLRGLRGRYAVPKLNIHIFRRHAITISDSLGMELAPQVFSFDPSGREIALYAGVTPPDTGGYLPPQPWHMKMPIGPALLNHALFAITATTNLAGMGPRLPALVGATIEGQRQLAELARLDIGGPPTYPPVGSFRALQAATKQSDCGKYQIYGSVLEVATGSGFATLTDRAAEFVAAANLSSNAAVPDFPLGTNVLIDPVRGIARLSGQTAFLPRTYNYGCFAPVGAGGHDREVSDDPGAAVVNSVVASLAPIVLAPAGLAALVRYPASLTWQLSGALPAFANLSWKASNRARPYVQLARSSGTQAVISSSPTDATKPPDHPDNLREIVIDGLWLAVAMASYPEQVLLAPGEAVTPVLSSIVIDATAAPIQKVTLRNVTLDPGGERARLLPCRATAIPFVRLLLKGEIGELLIENSVIGPIEEFAAASDPCSAGRVTIRDSIVHAIRATQPAIHLRSGELTIERSTVFGKIMVNRLYASELLVTGQVIAADNQHGCFRFSAAGDDPAMRLPRQFESHRIAGGIVPHMFVSQRFGDAGYAQLSQTIPPEIETGAENGSEIGAYSGVLGPIKLRDLATKLEEYAPLNTIPGFVLES